MAVEIVGSPEAVKRYREHLHKQGTYTKRFQKEIDAGVMRAQHEDYRSLKAQFKMVPQTKEAPSEDNKDDMPENKMSIVGIANENAVDRMDERLEPSGIDIENFKSNPVLLIDHLYMTRAVVGNVTNVTPEDNGVKFTADLAEKTDEGLTEAQKETRILVKQGLVGTVSVGFIPHKIRAPEYDNEGRLIEPPVILQWELLEISIVAIPANAGSTFEMKELARRLAFMDTSHGTRQNDAKELTSGSTSEIIDGSNSNTTKDLTGENMEELKDLLAELLGLVKAQVEAQKSQSEILKELVAKGSNSEEDEEEEKEEDLEEDMDEEEEDEDEKKALDEIRQSVKANAESIENIAKVLTDLVQGSKG